MMLDDLSTLTDAQLIRWAVFLPRILGPKCRAELTRRWGGGAEITDREARAMKLALEEAERDGLGH